jgi:hypothetical protein
MRLSMPFSAWGPWKWGQRKLEPPISVELPPYGAYEIKAWAEAVSPLPDGGDDHRLVVLAERSVDSSTLELVETPFWSDPEMTKRAQAVYSPEVGELSDGVLALVGAISFAIGVALEPAPMFGFDLPSQFFPETGAERQLLRDFGTARCHVPIAGVGGVEIFDDTVVDAALIQKLAHRHAVRVYPEVLNSNEPAAKFRQLWRVLELSFQAHGRDLLDLLEAFPPVQRLGFDRAELERLLVLRGRLSHAASRLGHLEVGRSSNEAAASLGRLWSLVDWVLLSKKSSSRSLDVEELEELAAYITEDGAVNVVGDIENPREWVQSWGKSGIRFAPPGAFD